MNTTRTTDPNTGSFKEVSDSHQNSIELGQTSKGDWYIKSIKIYESDPEAQGILLRRSCERAEAIVKVRNENKIA